MIFRQCFYRTNHYRYDTTNFNHLFQKLMCCAADVLEGKGTVQVAITVTELLRRHAALRASPHAVSSAT